ncbi:MAG: PDDEXK nuclease domain-containing protein [Deltaproteobacteria bacterium]|nr:PDDEXK nuclease domain-containing protein [Kofleriaceae bacterium]
MQPRKKSAAPTRRSSRSPATVTKPSEFGDLDVPALVHDLGTLIDDARKGVAVTANAALTTLYWQIGRRIHGEILHARRAEYGGHIVSAVGRQLQARYGKGFGEKSIRHMIRFAEAFPDPEIVSALRRQLTWTHFKQLIYIDDELKRAFYVEMSRVEGWSTRELNERIAGMLFERTALSKKPEAIIRKELSALREKGEVSPALVFRDPYMLDFLELADTYSERDLESAILREIERFVLELGTGFAFVERQKRITLDGDDYYLDLLFFHRRMHRLVAIDLKLGDFKPADSGQMELYLRWLDRHERQPSEQSPLGIILCAGKKRETVEYLNLDARGIHVAEYLTELPPREVLEARLHRAIEAARNRLALGSELSALDLSPPATTKQSTALPKGRSAKHRRRTRR